MSATVLPEAAPQPTYEAEGALGLPPLWVPPPEVDPVSRRDLADLITSLSRFLGMRTAGWVMLGGGVLLLVAGWLLRWQELRVAGILAILLVLVAAFVLYYLFTRPEAAAEAVRSFFGAFVSIGRFFTTLAG